MRDGAGSDQVAGGRRQGVHHAKKARHHGVQVAELAKSVWRGVHHADGDRAAPASTPSSPREHASCSWPGTRSTGLAAASWPDWRQAHTDAWSLQAMFVERILAVVIDDPGPLLRRAAMHLVQDLTSSAVARRTAAGSVAANRRCGTLARGPRLTLGAVMYALVTIRPGAGLAGFPAFPP